MEVDWNDEAEVDGVVRGAKQLREAQQRKLRRAGSTRTSTTGARSSLYYATTAGADGTLRGGAAATPTHAATGRKSLAHASADAAAVAGNGGAALSRQSTRGRVRWSSTEASMKPTRRSSLPAALSPRPTTPHNSESPRRASTAGGGGAAAPSLDKEDDGGSIKRPPAARLLVRRASAAARYTSTSNRGKKSSSGTAGGADPTAPTAKKEGSLFGRSRPSQRPSWTRAVAAAAALAVSGGSRRQSSTPRDDAAAASGPWAPLRRNSSNLGPRDGSVGGSSRSSPHHRAPAASAAESGDPSGKKALPLPRPASSMSLRPASSATPTARASGIFSGGIARADSVETFPLGAANRLTAAPEQVLISMPPDDASVVSHPSQLPAPPGKVASKQRVKSDDFNEICDAFTLTPSMAHAMRRRTGSCCCRGGATPAGALAAAQGAKRRLNDPDIERVYQRTLHDARGLVYKVRVAVLFIYISWALLSWFVFVYGSLILQLLGDKSQASFVRDWGIGLAMEVRMSNWRSRGCCSVHSKARS